MRVLVACERSGVIREAFRALGHDAWSADLVPAEDSSDYHYEGDVRFMLGNGCVPGFDLVIAHPSCQYLSNSGVLRLYRDGKKVNGPDPERWRKLDEAAAFFRWFWDLPPDRARRLCIENPVMHCHGRERIGGLKPAQSIQPWQFGEDAAKRTCLWLRGLPTLKLDPGKFLIKKQYANQTPSGQNKLGPSPMRSMNRARTYPAVARAMAEQWGKL